MWRRWQFTGIPCWKDLEENEDGTQLTSMVSRCIVVTASHVITPKGTLQNTKTTWKIGWHLTKFLQINCHQKKFLYNKFMHIHCHKIKFVHPCPTSATTYRTSVTRSCARRATRLAQLAVPSLKKREKHQTNWSLRGGKYLLKNMKMGTWWPRNIDSTFLNILYL